jgi:hypothetical protein
VKVLLWILAFFLALCFTVGTCFTVYECIVKAPWYTYENYEGDRIIMGQEPATLRVLDEKGKTVGSIRGYAFPDSDKTVTRTKDAAGKTVYVDNAKLPLLLQTADTLFYPELSIVRAKSFSEAIPGIVLLLAMLAAFILCRKLEIKLRKMQEQ